MSRLNAGAYEFVPGKGFVAPTPRPPPPPEPVDRPEQIEAPKPAPTISLNIGGAPKPPALSPVPTPTPTSARTAQTTPKPSASPVISDKIPAKVGIVSTAAPSSKTFSSEKAKTDTLAIAKEVLTVADESVLEDLYGDGTFVGSFHLPRDLIYLKQSRNI